MNRAKQKALHGHRHSPLVWTGYFIFGIVFVMLPGIFGVTRFFNVQDAAAAEHERYKEYHAALAQKKAAKAQESSEAAPMQAEKE